MTPELYVLHKVMYCEQRLGLNACPFVAGFVNIVALSCALEVCRI